MKVRYKGTVDELHEFEYTKTEDKKYYIHTLLHSQSDSWSESIKGTVAFQIKERIEDSQLEFPALSSLSLCEAEYFDILLRLVLREENMPRVIEICKRELL